MDTQLYVSILREHSEHLSRLATTLSAKLTQLEHSLNKQVGSPSPDTVTFVEGMAKLQHRLLTERHPCSLSYRPSIGNGSVRNTEGSVGKREQGSEDGKTCATRRGRVFVRNNTHLGGAGLRPGQSFTCGLGIALVVLQRLHPLH